MPKLIKSCAICGNTILPDHSYWRRLVSYMPPGQKSHEWFCSAHCLHVWNCGNMTHTDSTVLARLTALERAVSELQKVH